MIINQQKNSNVTKNSNWNDKENDKRISWIIACSMKVDNTWNFNFNFSVLWYYKC